MMLLHIRPRCPLTLVVDTCSYLVQGSCYHACWTGQACPMNRVSPEEFQLWCDAAAPVRPTAGSDAEAENAAASVR